MRLIIVLIVLILQEVAAAAGIDAIPAQGGLHCESQGSAGDTRDIKCPLNASGATQRFRFKANFSGGHDDTTASMTATLNGMPLACEKDSKTSLMGEDGDVSLECKFSIKEKADTTHVLKVTLSWCHAWYTDFEFDSD
jgi:hypothetical protein